MTKKPLSNIKTNLITGFLGVGKTSAILHLMKQKPADEKWSVLVNEFGHVGIDGAIYEAEGIQVKEIPGGCMCCSAGVPLQVAVNQILKATRPDRLLIEPSGLGHPKRVLDTLRGEHFKNVLQLQASICLIDPRNILDSRYTNHENFIDQISLADVLVANKIDLCDETLKQQLTRYLADNFPDKAPIVEAQFGMLDIALLDRNTQDNLIAQYPHHHMQGKSEATPTDGYTSSACTFSADTIFNLKVLEQLFEKLNTKSKVERIKAIIQTEQGWRVFNIHKQQIQMTPIHSSKDNRIEVIERIKKSQKNISFEELKSALRNCI